MMGRRDLLARGVALAVFAGAAFASTGGGWAVVGGADADSPLIAALVLLVGALLFGMPDRVGAISTIAAGMCALASVAAPLDPAAAAVVGAVVPLAYAPLFRRAAPLALLIGTLTGASGAALAVVQASYAAEPQPWLARIGLALLVVYASLLGGAFPLHLWALGASRVVRPEVLAGVTGIGGIAAARTIGSALEHYPWFVGVVDARALLASVGVAALVVGALAPIGEERPARLALQLAGVAAGAGWLSLAGEAQLPAETVTFLFADRAVALALALIGVALLGTEGCVAWRRRLVTPGAIVFLTGVAGLAGLPPTGGFLARVEAIGSLAPTRGDLAFVALIGSVLGVLAMRRATLVLTDPATRSDARGSEKWLAAAPQLALAAAYGAAALIGSVAALLAS